MIAGIVLIVAGLGIAMIGIARSYRRAARHHDNPVIDRFFRF